MEKLIVIDGNSILNRAFYGIMGSKMLQTADGTYTNAVYGFLNIMFRILEDENPEYLVVAFDVKSPTKRHEMYSEYKGTRKGMPDELAVQLPIIKKVLEAMNIKVLEKPGYEADDILGTLSDWGDKQGLKVILLTGDRDSFQLAKDNVIIRIPRTKQGKTETEDFDANKVFETYQVTPKQMIEVKGLMGDTSDNIPGVPGVGEKTALNLIQKYKNIDQLYEAIENGDPNIKGKQKEKLVENKELAYLSRTLGTIDLEAPIEKSLEEFRIETWDKVAVLELFKELRFKRFIEKFQLENSQTEKKLEDLFEIVEIPNIEEISEKLKSRKELFYYFETESDEQAFIIKKKIKKMQVYLKPEKKVYSIKFEPKEWQAIFENETILKCGYQQKDDYILLKQVGIKPKNMMFDTRIAMYLLNSGTNLYSLEEVARQHLNLEIEDYEKTDNQEQNVQTSFFDNELEVKQETNYKNAIYSYIIGEAKSVLEEKLREVNQLELFLNVEMPCVEVLAEMRYTGVFVEREDIEKMSENLKQEIDKMSKEIYELAGQEFNINSPKQLGEILFEKLELPFKKKNKNGYATDVDTLEKLTQEHPIIEKVLYYRQISKLNSTFVEGMLPFINPNTKRIHTTFHQTVAATGRLSSSDPNLQNIPTRTDLGKQIRKLFKAEEGKVFLDADYSQIELRVLAHMSQDEIMIKAFQEHNDIHQICASQVFGVPLEEVTKEMRSHAKAVNFGIVYGISDFGLAEQLGIKRKEAKQYIDSYLEKYHGIEKFMEEEIEKAKEKGYVETMFHRRRYIPEITSNNYMVRKFGDRVAMNAPIQGTAADIMKIAMIEVYHELNNRNLKSKIVLQIHDELIIEALESEKEEVSRILRECMERASELSVQLEVDLQEGKTWYQTK